MAELRAIIDRAASGNATAGDQLAREALELSAYRATVRDHHELALLDDAIAGRAEEIVGDPIATEEDPDTGGPTYIYDENRESRAGLFAAMARGEATPIDYHHKDFLAQSINKVRTKGDDRRAIAFLLAWCEQTSTPATLEAITRKEALRFHDALPKLPGAPASPVTLNKYLGRLSVYWQWLRHRELVETDVWARIKIPEPATPHDELERSFTDEEVRRLLTGPASPAMRDLMMIAALTSLSSERLLRAEPPIAQLVPFAITPSSSSWSHTERTCGLSALSPILAVAARSAADGGSWASISCTLPASTSQRRCSPKCGSASPW